MYENVEGNGIDDKLERQLHSVFSGRQTKQACYTGAGSERRAAGCMGVGCMERPLCHANTTFK